MKRLVFSTFLLTFAAFTLINAKVVCNYSSQSDGKLTFEVDSIDYRDDLTRVYGRLIGHPHTSNRIDKVEITVVGTTCESTDIDGVDFRRYFQWEDNGCIPIELDFPKIRNANGAKVTFDTPYGKSITEVKVAQPTKHK